MSNTISKLNDCNNLPFLKVKELEEGKKYELVHLESMEGKFGEFVVAQIKEQPNKVILPKRFSKIIPEIKKINTDISKKKVYMVIEVTNNYYNVKFE